MAFADSKPWFLEYANSVHYTSPHVPPHIYDPNSKSGENYEKELEQHEEMAKSQTNLKYRYPENKDEKKEFLFVFYYDQDGVPVSYKFSYYTDSEYPIFTLSSDFYTFDGNLKNYQYLFSEKEINFDIFKKIDEISKNLNNYEKKEQILNGLKFLKIDLGVKMQKFNFSVSQLNFKQYVKMTNQKFRIKHVRR